MPTATTPPYHARVVLMSVLLSSLPTAHVGDLYQSLLEVERSGRKYLFRTDLYGDNLLAVRIIDERRYGRTIRFEAKG